MRVCVIGFGVIGTVYGCAFAEAGHEVVHYMPGRAERSREGAEINLLDARGTEQRGRRIDYRPKVVERLEEAGAQLVLASVRHYQLPELVPLLAAGRNNAEILFFNNLWTSFEPIDAELGGGYLWGFPVAGGGFNGGVLEAALLATVNLGAPPAVEPARVERLSEFFSGCGFEVERRS